jgi:hypothetical protein
MEKSIRLSKKYKTLPLKNKIHNPKILMIQPQLWPATNRWRISTKKK